jgi:hypothetical protein
VPAPPKGGAGERSEPERIRFPQRRAFSESGAANAAFRYDPSCEKAILENPQIFQNCEIINILSADYAQSKRGAHFKSSHPLIFIISLLTTNLILP